MKCKIICKASYILLILKSMIFTSLAVIFYIFYFTEVVNKFAERDTTLINSQETLEETNSPFITFCLDPRSKNSLLEGYKLSKKAIYDPTYNDQNVLKILNKTIETLFREVTFKLNRDFYLYINLWFYEEGIGWQNYRGKMKEGSDNYIEVQSKPTYFYLLKLATLFMAQY